MSQLFATLNSIDKLKICTRISDPKFEPLIQSHHGSFINQQGKWYVDVKFNPNYTVITGEKVASYDKVHGSLRHVNCLLLLEDSVVCSHCKLNF